jgi:exodeoxyribonuclease VII small subunit
MNYEEMMARLQEITSRLEREQLPLDEAAKLYAEGMELAGKCHKILEEAALRVQEIPVPGKEENNNG